MYESSSISVRRVPSSQNARLWSFNRSPYICWILNLRPEIFLKMREPIYCLATYIIGTSIIGCSAIKSSICYVDIFCYKNCTTVNRRDLVKSFHHQYSELDENFCTWQDYLYRRDFLYLTRKFELQMFTSIKKIPIIKKLRIHSCLNTGVLEFTGSTYWYRAINAKRKSRLIVRWNVQARLISTKQAM